MVEQRYNILLVPPGTDKCNDFYFSNLTEVNIHELYPTAQGVSLDELDHQKHPGQYFAPYRNINGKQGYLLRVIGKCPNIDDSRLTMGKHTCHNPASVCVEEEMARRGVR